MELTNKKLRATLYEALEGVKSGKVKVEEALAIANVSRVILQSAKLDLECYQIHGVERDAFKVEEGKTNTTPLGEMPRGQIETP